MGETNEQGYPPESPQQHDVRGSRGRKRGSFLRGCLIVLIALILLAAAAVAGAAWLIRYEWKPVESSDEPVRLTVEKGMGSQEIAGLLEQDGLIKSRFFFSLYLKYKHEGSRFQAGVYEMSPGISLDGIIAKLNNGEVVKQPTIHFTVPEGFTIDQIAARLGEEGLIDKGKFLALANEPERFSGQYLADIPQDAKMKYKLEGYLFPDTYELKQGSGEEDVMAAMIAGLDGKLAGLPDGWQGQLQQLDISFHQMLTIASLVEREAVLPEERPIIAGVIYNRLHAKPPMRLQIDATIQYALGQQKEALSTADTQLDSPYNTYQHDGLPPGPIASPSLASIKAALYPEKSQYLYYVARDDGSHGHYFSETYSQFLKDKNKSKSNAQKSGQSE